MWQDEGFAPGVEDDPDVGGMRVSRFQSYMDQVDWTDRSHVSRALRVFETALPICVCGSGQVEWPIKTRSNPCPGSGRGVPVHAARPPSRSPLSKNWPRRSVPHLGT